MAESNDSDFVKDESATPDSPEKPEKKEKKKKGRKKKKRGCGFFLLLLLLAGVAAGIQASGGADFRPFVYEVLPKIPFVGRSLSELLGVPKIYSLTVEERRRIELDEWSREIAEEVRSLDARMKGVTKLSRDLGTRERELDAARTELAERLEALSRDLGESARSGLSAEQKSELDRIVRTFREMSPKNAAAILEKTEINLAVAVLEGLQEDLRAKILGRMEPELAAKLMEELSRRKNR